MGRIKCCNGCVPPKRTPYCHGTCPDYIAAKAANDAELERQRKENLVSYGLYAQKCRNVEKAYKSRKKGG